MKKKKSRNFYIGTW